MSYAVSNKFLSQNGVHKSYSNLIEGMQVTEALGAGDL